MFPSSSHGRDLTQQHLCSVFDPELLSELQLMSQCARSDCAKFSCRKRALTFSCASSWFFYRLRGEPRLGRRGPGREDVVLLRLTLWPGPGPLWRVFSGLHGGSPGGAAVRGPVEALPRHRHGDDHHQGGQVGANRVINTSNDMVITQSRKSDSNTNHKHGN